jgi:hypothetical protein
MRDLSVKIDRLAAEASSLTSDDTQKSTSLESAQPAMAQVNSGYQVPLHDGGMDQTMQWPLSFGDEVTTAEIGGILGHSIDISAETLTDIDWSNLNNAFFDQWPGAF